jgi:dimethylhistidine N-methyltransferase
MIMDSFLNDVLKGLRSQPKYLFSKYFYDEKGDELFQKIMASGDYYLTNCEMEIFSKQTADIADAVLKNDAVLDVIEFGAGDATKSVFLLKELVKRNAIHTYFPIDISKNIIDFLEKKLPGELPQLSIHGLNGEYLEMLAQTNHFSTKRKLVLFLGANIGNFKFNEMPDFCKKLRSLLSERDSVLIGFDLKKHPRKILSAYDDREGFTSQFNLNLLTRINNELDGNFDLGNFEHYATYDPASGACKSYLVSLKKQQVVIADEVIGFEENETIFMEISQKYSIEQINETALSCGFAPSATFYDSKRYFVNVVWKCA